ncbi:MAG TPA: septum formation initiator family protein [Methylomirabilota bacterium]
MVPRDLEYVVGTVTRQAEPRASKAIPPPSGRDRGRRVLRVVLYVAAATLLGESLFGTRGIPALLQARREHRTLTASLEQLRAENERLRQRAHLLRSDPLTIESLARRELTMMAPGEKVFIVTDRRPGGR